MWHGREIRWKTKDPLIAERWVEQGSKWKGHPSTVHRPPNRTPSRPKTGVETFKSYGGVKCRLVSRIWKFGK